MIICVPSVEFDEDSKEIKISKFGLKMEKIQLFNQFEINIQLFNQFEHINQLVTSLD